ncbi:MAG TPA: CehA/McbA family metallohydrolase [Verrucomicrobiae bacterium]|nr:CehA/McbA family metallohydrolase [Verrucomicrobiae bacterium]
MRLPARGFAAALLVSFAAWAAAPDAFTFLTRSGVATGVLITSEAKTLSGFTGTLPVSVSGGVNPQYRIGTGSWTASPGGLVLAGQTLTVRHVSASAPNTESITTVAVGDYTTPFRSITGATDRTPDAFDFGTLTNTQPSSFVVSPARTPTGFNTSISIVPGTGAQYSIEGAVWTNASGTLTPGQSLRMRHLTSADRLGYTRTNLKVGTITAEFTTRNAGEPEVSIADAAQPEGHTGQGALTFTVSLTGTSAVPVTVRYATTDGTAKAGTDYASATGTLVFAPGELAKTLAVSINGDTIAEDDETFIVTLSQPVGATLADASATGTIVNDDFPFLVGTGAADHNPIAPVCVGGGATFCGRRVDPAVPGAIRDDLIARAAAITGANGQTFIIVTTTNIGYFLAYKPEQSGYNGIYDVRLRIADATGVPSTNIVVVSDHSHNGPDTIGIWGGVDESYMRITANAVVNAALAAYDSRKPAVIKVAAVNQNDRPVPGVPRLDSSYSRPPANDPEHGAPANEFRVLVADGAEGRLLTLVNYAPHATVLNGAATNQLSGDWAAWAPQEAELAYGGFGLATIGTVGATDWNKFGNNADQKENEARSRIRTLMTAATAELGMVQGGDVKVDSVFIHEQITAPILAANYKPGLPKPGTPADNFDVRIDRAVTPPWLSGTVVGTYTSAIRVGDVFMSTFPGEPFGELEWALNGEGGVRGARAQFLFGGANDFFGYMVRYPETYQQTLRAGATWLAGCPEQEFIFEPAGVDYEDSCADHFALMVSPTIGTHIVCSLQDAADRLGFTTGPRDAACPVLTALDNLAPPPESGSALRGVPVDVTGTLEQQVRDLVKQCAGSGAPASLCAALTAGTEPLLEALPQAPQGDGKSYAGVAIKDASWHLGASAGQFAASGAGIARDRGYDPYGHSTRKVGSDILGTRITTRALVVQGANGQRIAVASNDLYLPNDLLHRRTAQLLAEHDLLAKSNGGVVTGITDVNLATTSSHSHTSPFYSTPSWGTWIFQDVFDLRFYEYMARQMADAVIEAAGSMKPVRMGGATVLANDIQAHTYGPGVAHDGTPAGQPRDYTTQAVTVVSFDDISTGVPKPLANWVIFGVHPEWVWGEEIVNGDITHAVMRMLDRETGATTVWSQRETGSSGPHKDDRVHLPAARHEFQETNFAGYDRAARMLTDSIKRALGTLASGTPERSDQYAAYQTGFVVASSSLRAAPPATRPYPGVSNCNSDRVFEGDVGTVVVPGLPDCSYDADEALDPITEPFWNALPADPAELARQLNAVGVPIPTSYSGTSLSAVQETAAVHLQAFKLGTIAATLSPNEQFTSQALNIESRLDKVHDNLWLGFDFACVAQKRGLLPVDDDPIRASHCARQNARYPENRLDLPGGMAALQDEDFPRARAQIYNDASGWEFDPAYAMRTGDDSGIRTLGGESEPTDITQIKGNFTHEEFTDNGYDLVVSVGMANDYWGYMAEYREYRSHSNGYRKALNALGPHGSDFVATRLTRMAANLNGANVALPFNPLDAAYQAESARADALARTMGNLARAYTTVYDATLPPDGGAPAVVEQPAPTVPRFSAAVLKFIGGSNYTDMPNVRVERFVGGAWQTYGTQEGEVQLQLQFLPAALQLSQQLPIDEGVGAALPDPQALALWRAGQFEWVWTANFEAFVSELDNLGGRPGITPAGTYRFVVDGKHRGLTGFPNATPYHLESRSFEVVAWDGITVEDLRLDTDGRVSFKVGPVNTFTQFKSGAGDGNTTRNPGFTVGPVDYPDSYAGGVSWIRNERQLFAGDEQYCGRCTFRPWADSAQLAVDSIPVTVRRADGSSYVLAATQSGGRWITGGAINDGDTAQVAARVIVDEYGERNGAPSASITRDVNAPADADGDGVADAVDACPAQPGPASNNGCPRVTPADRDGDGIPDATDACPSQPGRATNNGCPSVGTGASLTNLCRASSPQPAACDALNPLIEGCNQLGDEAGDDAGAFCRAVLTGDLDLLLALCAANAPDAQACGPIASLADALATRNPWLTRRPLNISHRGGADEFPENTLYAYAQSLAVGSDMLEADVYETADGEIVVIHDASVDRTTNGSGAVSSFTVDQLKALDAAHCFRAGGSNCSDPDASKYPFRGIATGAKPAPAGFTANDFRIPTLRELLARFPDTLINLELKPDPDSTGSYEGKVAALLAEFGRTDDVIVASFLDTAAAAFKAQAPQVSTSVPTGQVAASVASGQGPGPGITVGHEAFQVPIQFSGVPVIDQNFVDDAHARGLAVQAWTIDICDEMVDLLDLGVDGIMTDRPSLLQRVLDDRATKPRAQWVCQGTGGGGTEPPPASEGGVQGGGVLGALGRFFSALGEALLAMVSGDAGAAQAAFTGALETFGGDAETIATGGETDPVRVVGLDRVLPTADEGSCTAANDDWAAFAQYKGSLHEHSGYSDGTPATQPRDYFAAGAQQGLDFMGGTDHSDNADIPMTVSAGCASAALPSCVIADDVKPQDSLRKWDASLEHARAATTASFTAFRGFEWTSDRFGHINVLFSRNDFNAKTTEGYSVSMESFWLWFTTRPEAGGGNDALAVFNHPGREDMVHAQVPSGDPAYAFNDFAYRPEADLRMVGIETFGKGGDAYDTFNDAPTGGWYAYALDHGWHVGPVGAEDEHGTSWGQGKFAKTILIARDRSEGALREAMMARRFYSLSQGHNDIRLSFTGDGEPMGARLARAAGQGVTLTGAITAGNAVHHVDIVTAGGTVLATQPGGSIAATVLATADERWYYLRAVRADGRPIAYSAPIWVQARGAYPVCGEWLAGDLHVHSTYSHDSYGGPGDDNTGPEEAYILGHSVESQFRIAATRGLDYLGISDHNDVRSQRDPGFGAFGVVGLPSYENSLSGHAQMHGAGKIYDAGTKSAAAVNAMADALRADGGVFQINHPADGPGEYPDNLGWSYGYNVVPDTVEVWNIGPRYYQKPAPANTNNDDSTRFWEGWLDHGHRVAATGGSDNHWVSTTAVQGNGQPTTWIFATERSARGLLDGLKRGRTTISHQPPLLQPARVMIEADADGDGVYEALAGDSVPENAALRVRAQNAGGALLRVFTSGGGAFAGAPVPVVTPVFEYRFTLPAGARWVRAEIAAFDADGQREALEPACDAIGLLGENGFPEDTQTTYCRNQLAVLAMSSALYLQP